MAWFHFPAWKWQSPRLPRTRARAGSALSAGLEGGHRVLVPSGLEVGLAQGLPGVGVARVELHRRASRPPPRRGACPHPGGFAPARSGRRARVGARSRAARIDSSGGAVLALLVVDPGHPEVGVGVAGLGLQHLGQELGRLVDLALLELHRPQRHLDPGVGARLPRRLQLGGGGVQLTELPQRAARGRNARRGRRGRGTAPSRRGAGPPSRPCARPPPGPAPPSPRRGPEPTRWPARTRSARCPASPEARARSPSPMPDPRVLRKSLGSGRRGAPCASAKRRWRRCSRASCSPASTLRRVQLERRLVALLGVGVPVELLLGPSGEERDARVLGERRPGPGRRGQRLLGLVHGEERAHLAGGPVRIPAVELHHLGPERERPSRPRAARRRPGQRALGQRRGGVELHRLLQPGHRVLARSRASSAAPRIASARARSTGASALGSTSAGSTCPSAAVASFFSCSASAPALHRRGEVLRGELERRGEDRRRPCRASPSSGAGAPARASRAREGLAFTAPSSSSAASRAADPSAAAPRPRGAGPSASSFEARISASAASGCFWRRARPTSALTRSGSVLESSWRSSSGDGGPGRSGRDRRCPTGAVPRRPTGTTPREPRGTRGGRGAPPGGPGPASPPARCRRPGPSSPR